MFFMAFTQALNVANGWMVTTKRAAQDKETKSGSMSSDENKPKGGTISSDEKEMRSGSVL